MKALTLIQPWATLIADGFKQIETRSWGTSYRGPLAIHAGKRMDEEAYWKFEDSLLANYWDASVMPTGAVIAVATLVDCVHMTPVWIAEQSDEERDLGLFLPGRYGWVLDNVHQIAPVPMRGYQGLWDAVLGTEAGR